MRPQPDRATLGGIYATNTCGPRRFGAGRPRDQIIGVSFVTSDGAVVKGGGRVVKNVAGYDFPKLLTGSMGTLGIITQLTLKVRPIPEASAIAWVPFTARAPGRRRSTGSTRRGPGRSPWSCSTRPAARVVGQTLGIAGRAPVLAIGFEDNAGSVAWQLDRLKIELGRADLVIVEGEPTPPLWDALTEFQAAELGPFSFVANIRPSTVVGIRRRARPATMVGPGPRRQRDRPGPCAGRVDPGRVRARRSSHFRRGPSRDGGNLILSRCPTEWKERLRVWGEPRPDWAIAERVKDGPRSPRGMNPGRFVGRI